jgi:hypothetical protein
MKVKITYLQMLAHNERVVPPPGEGLKGGRPRYNSGGRGRQGPDGFLPRPLLPPGRMTHQRGPRRRPRLAAATSREGRLMR